MTTDILQFVIIFALFTLLRIRIYEQENKITDLRKRLDVLDKPCE